MLHGRDAGKRTRGRALGRQQLVAEWLQGSRLRVFDFCTPCSETESNIAIYVDLMYPDRRRGHFLRKA